MTRARDEPRHALPLARIAPAEGIKPRPILGASEEKRKVVLFIVENSGGERKFKVLENLAAGVR